jgi:predicted  nucleic acid-binding Zn-ribbon protein
MKKAPSKKKKMTIDNLATLMGAGFLDANTKFDKGFRDISTKFDKGFRDISTKFDKEIGDLARMTAKGFDGVHKEMRDFKGEVNERFDEIDSRFNHLETAVFKIDSKVESIDKRLKKVEEAIEPLLVGYRIMQKEIQELSSRVFLLEKKAGVIK